MKISLNWLKEYLNLDGISVDELYQIFSLHISEVETVTPLINADNLMVGKVIKKEPHPDSDHLNICQVELKDGISQIVCGAPNVDVNQKVIVALPGAKLPGITIKPAKVRGVESNGMICALQELGIEDKNVDEKYKNGIYVLPDEAIVGSSPFETLGFDDVIFDLELTSNRSDLLSIEGVVYDLAAYLGQEVKIKEPLVKEVRMVNPVNVKIETEDCFEFACRYIKNVKIKESPMWLKMKLMASGIRPINNIVDITNLVLIEMGQPLHAYDYNITGNNIIIRNAENNEKFITLDEIERELNENDIVVANAKEALCLGGVMGGLHSEVSANTTDIILEAALFSPLKVRKTSTRLGLKSESSIRFERKTDQLRLIRALDYAASLISELAEGTVVGGMAREVKKPYVEKKVNITTSKINNILGTSLTDDDIIKLFNNLNYIYKNDCGTYEITIPSRRMDLEASVQDIVEDIARMIGYDNIPTTIQKVESAGGLTEKQKKIRMIKETLSNMGLNEVITYSLVSETELHKYTLNNLDSIKVLMPLTSDREIMRQSLLNGILNTIRYNKDRKLNDCFIFEIGKRYGLNVENTVLAGALTGIFNSSIWQGKATKVDFYLVKGLLEELFRRLNLELTFMPYKEIKDTYHPGRSAKILIDQFEVGFLASLHPKFMNDNDFNETYVFELDLDKIFEIGPKFNYKPIAKFPSIERDLAIVIKDNIKAQEIIDIVKMVAKKYLVDIKIFDIYKGEGIAEDEKSIAFKMTFLDSTKTLESQDVDKVINSILNRLDFYFKARLR